MGQQAASVGLLGECVGAWQWRVSAVAAVEHATNISVCICMVIGMQVARCVVGASASGSALSAACRLPHRRTTAAKRRVRRQQVRREMAVLRVCRETHKAPHTHTDTTVCA